MKVLLAGATGAIGVPLTHRLVAAGHEVVGITRSGDRAGRVRGAGGTPLVADVMDRDGLLRAVRGLRVDAVIHELTALQGTPRRHRDMAGTDALRTTGTANLIEAARATGARRYLTQSIVFGYGHRDHGDRVITERDAFGVPQPGAAGVHVAAMRSAEQQAFRADGIEGVALRYGLFYGTDIGTRSMIDQLRRRRLPVPRGGGGYLPWVHLDDAADATAAALERATPGHAYNVVADEPVRFGAFVEELARAAGAPAPARIPVPVLRLLPYAYTMVNTSMRVSNAAARRVLGWEPAYPDHRTGIARVIADLAAVPASR